VFRHTLSLSAVGVAPRKSATRTFATLIPRMRRLDRQSPAGSNWATGPLGITPLTALGPDLPRSKTRSNTSRWTGDLIRRTLARAIVGKPSNCSFRLPSTAGQAIMSHGPGNSASFATTPAVCIIERNVFSDLHLDVWSARRAACAQFRGARRRLFLTAVNGWNAPRIRVFRRHRVSVTQTFGLAIFEELSSAPWT